MATTTEILHLPAGFLQDPGPAVKVTKIDFANTTVTEYKDDYAVVLDNVLSPDECRALINGIDMYSEGQWECALVNLGNGGQTLHTNVRKCSRVIWDSRDLSARIWARVEPHVPEIHRLTNWPGVTGIGPTKRGEAWKVSRLNERMRFLRYEPGDYFKPHHDGTYETPDKKERSYFTLHLYLNDVDTPEEKEPLHGGATVFHSWDLSQSHYVEPKAGSVLLFQQRNLRHSGDEVTQGRKFSVRSDILYTKEEGVKVEVMDLGVDIKEKVKKRWGWQGAAR